MKIDIDTGKKARIEMLPLIDIVFLLLVFFIYAMFSMAVHKALPVELPGSSTAEIEKKSVLSVTVDSNVNVYVDKIPVSLQTLSAVLEKKSPKTAETSVLLFADKNLPYQDLFRVLDQINMAGIQQVSLQAETDNKK
jgi:biopolymer transport protein ExbD